MANKPDEPKKFQVKVPWGPIGLLVVLLALFAWWGYAPEGSQPQQAQQPEMDGGTITVPSFDVEGLLHPFKSMPYGVLLIALISGGIIFGFIWPRAILAGELKDVLKEVQVSSSDGYSIPGDLRIGMIELPDPEAQWRRGRKEALEAAERLIVGKIWETVAALANQTPLLRLDSMLAAAISEIQNGPDGWEKILGQLSGTTGYRVITVVVNLKPDALSEAEQASRRAEASGTAYAKLLSAFTGGRAPTVDDALQAAYAAIATGSTATNTMLPFRGSGGGG